MNGSEVVAWAGSCERSRLGKALVPFRKALLPKVSFLPRNFFDLSIFKAILDAHLTMDPLTKYTLLLGLGAAGATHGFGQLFVDGDPGMTLYTNHTGGYLGHGVSFADFNGDGFDDLTFAQYQQALFFYTGDGNGNFTEHNFGIESTEGEPKCVLWADFDNDGDQDLLVTQRLSLNKLYARMPDGGLAEVPNAGGLAGTELERTYGAAVADYDGDGLLDVYMANYHTPQTNSEENHLFKNVGGSDLGMGFTETTSIAGVGNGVKQSFQATWIDVDRDGWLDLHVINDRTIWSDALYRNNGDGTFEDLADLWGMDTYVYSMSTSFADYDKDGDWDVFIANGADLGNVFLRCEELGPPSANSGLPQLNYADVAEEAGVLLDNLAWGALWFDADCDGWQDLFVGTGTSLYTDYPAVLNYYSASLNGFFLNPQGELPLQDELEAVFTDNELTFCSAYGDVNRDGSVDFISHRIGPHARLLNGVPNGNHWLKVMLEGEGGNLDAIGAVVTVWRAGLGDMRSTSCGTAYMGQNSRWLHFGMGGAQSVDSLVVDWPGGGKTTLPTPVLDQHLVISQSGSTEVMWPDGGTSTNDGCTYPQACNFDPNASVDNGLCDFSCHCGPGTLWDPETQSCDVVCGADHDLDGVVGTGDLLLFLTAFATPCDALGMPSQDD
jgi:hypothetical protein